MCQIECHNIYAIFFVRYQNMCHMNCLRPLSAEKETLPASQSRTRGLN